MTKTQTMLMSLVAAVPAGILAFLLVMAFLGSGDKMAGLMPVVVGVTLLCAVLTALMPVGILLFGGPKTAKAPTPGKERPSQQKTVEDAPVDEDGDDLGGSFDDDDSDLSDEFDSDASDEFDRSEMDDFSDDDIRTKTSNEGWEDGPSDEFEFDDGLTDDEIDIDFEDDDF